MFCSSTIIILIQTMAQKHAEYSQARASSCPAWAPVLRSHVGLAVARGQLVAQAHHARVLLALDACFPYNKTGTVSKRTKRLMVLCWWADAVQSGAVVTHTPASTLPSHCDTGCE